MLHPKTKGVAMLFVGGALLGTGGLFYAACRREALLHDIFTISGEAPFTIGSDSLAYLNALPSFLFVLSFSLISMGLFTHSRNRYGWPLFWTAVTMFGELLQLDTLLGATFGTFDWNDLFAALTAGILAACLSPTPSHASRIVQRRMFARFGRLGTIGLGLFCLVASSPEGDHSSEHGGYDPIYLSYEKLRQPVTGEAPVEIIDVGKIYTYKNYILVNSPNEGIHVIDNTDPRDPVNKKFIDIPGNVDMAVKNDILYADSFIDLVAIDISDMKAPVEVHRVEDVFPYDPYQFIGEDIWLTDWDKEKGVVIGYER